jgi:ubiquinol-cytochrome c reductase iron-sulfur subunit
MLAPLPELLPERAGMAIERTEADPLGWHGSRRDILYVAAGLHTAGGMAAALWPLVDSMNPDADTVARHFRYMELWNFEVGQRKTVEWLEVPVFIWRRTPEEIAAAQSVRLGDLWEAQSDAKRVQRAEWLVVAGLCTYGGCALLGQEPDEPRGDWGGWFCPCCHSSYDTSGRVRRGMATRNLAPIPHTFRRDGSLLIGFHRYIPDLDQVSLQSKDG